MFLKRVSKSIVAALTIVTIGTSMNSTVLAMEFNNDSSNNVDLVEFETMLGEMDSYEETKYDDDAIIEELNMSYNDMKSLYEEFSAQNPKAINNVDGYDDTNDFVNYAVSVGAIEDNEEVKARMTIDAYRLQFKTAGTLLKGLGYFYTGDFLLNSVQVKPSTKSYAASSNLAADIKLQTAYKNAKSALKKSVASLPSSTTSYSKNNESLALSYSGINQKSWDMYLAINKANYSVKCTKSSGKWSSTMTLTDTYNFEYWNFSSAPNITKQIVTIINNYAVGAQKAGAIKPFSVKVLINDTL